MYVSTLFFYSSGAVHAYVFYIRCVCVYIHIIYIYTYICTRPRHQVDSTPDLGYMRLKRPRGCASATKALTLLVRRGEWGSERRTVNGHCTGQVWAGMGSHSSSPA